MFQSATLKLTSWYLLILMTISTLFSITIYNLTVAELDQRLEQLQSRLEDREARGLIAPPWLVSEYNSNFTAIRTDQALHAQQNILMSLVYVNIIILLFGGAGSYFLARRTLRPIEAAHEAQSRFTSDASHELRTPLAVMRMETEVALRDGTLTKSDMRLQLESNLEEVDKLTRLAETLLKLSRLEYESLEHTKVDLNTLVKNIVTKYDKTGKRIEFTPSGKDYFVNANLASLDELIIILIDNALKYSPSDSLITITTSKRNRQACFEITNTGKGISEFDLPHIFDRFFRSDTARNTSNELSGHGLGLSLAKKIVELHHGELAATSAPDRATTFTVLLPLYTKNPAVSQ